LCGRWGGLGICGRTGGWRVMEVCLILPQHLIWEILWILSLIMTFYIHIMSRVSPEEKLEPDHPGRGLS